MLHSDDFLYLQLTLGPVQIDFLVGSLGNVGRLPGANQCSAPTEIEKLDFESKAELGQDHNLDDHVEDAFKEGELNEPEQILDVPINGGVIDIFLGADVVCQ